MVICECMACGRRKRPSWCVIVGIQQARRRGECLGYGFEFLFLCQSGVKLIAVLRVYRSGSRVTDEGHSNLYCTSPVVLPWSTSSMSPALPCIHHQPPMQQDENDNLCVRQACLIFPHCPPWHHYLGFIISKAVAFTFKKPNYSNTRAECHFSINFLRCYYVIRTKIINFVDWLSARIEIAIVIPSILR